MGDKYYLVDTETDSAEAKTDDEAKPAKTKHRSIPTWEEAVGLIIGGNIENRSKRSGGGSSRGRGGARKAAGERKSSEGRKSSSRRSSKKSNKT